MIGKTPWAVTAPQDPPPADASEPLRRIAEYEMLFSVGVKLAGTLDPTAVLEQALESAEHVCRAETSSIWELDEERGDLFFRVVRGRAADDIRDLRVPLGEGIVGTVAQSGVSEIVQHVDDDPRWHGDPASTFRTRAILAVALRARGAVIGVLQLLNPAERESFTAGDLWLMEQFAAILAPQLQNARLYAEMERQFLNMVTLLAETIEKKDPYTGGHVRRVRAYSILLGEEMGLSRDELKDLRLAATVHDIGKIGVADSILGKPSPLDPEETELMKLHTVFGAQIVATLDKPNVLCGVRSHHERIDGKGYPDKLADADIPRTARIIAVADTFDAMTTRRPYRAALPVELAAAEIERGAGSQFCPLVVTAFRSIFAAGRFTLEEGELLLGSLVEQAG